MSRNEPSIETIRREFRIHGHPIGKEKAEKLQGVLERAGRLAGLSARDVLEITAVNAGSGALERLFVMLGGEDGKRSVHGEREEESGESKGDTASAGLGDDAV